MSNSAKTDQEQTVSAMAHGLDAISVNRLHKLFTRLAAVISEQQRVITVVQTSPLEEKPDTEGDFIVLEDLAAQIWLMTALALSVLRQDGRYSAATDDRVLEACLSGQRAGDELRHHWWRGVHGEEIQNNEDITENTPAGESLANKESTEEEPCLGPLPDRLILLRDFLFGNQIAMKPGTPSGQATPRSDATIRGNKWKLIAQAIQNRDSPDCDDHIMEVWGVVHDGHGDALAVYDGLLLHHKGDRTTSLRIGLLVKDDKGELFGKNFVSVSLSNIDGANFGASFITDPDAGERFMTREEALASPLRQLVFDVVDFIEWNDEHIDSFVGKQEMEKDQEQEGSAKEGGVALSKSEMAATIFRYFYTHARENTKSIAAPQEAAATDSQGEKSPKKETPHANEAKEPGAQQ